jgi:hypothetical protein
MRKKSLTLFDGIGDVEAPRSLLGGSCPQPIGTALIVCHWSWLAYALLWAGPAEPPQAPLWLTRAPAAFCLHLPFIERRWRLIVERLMWPFLIIKAEVVR